MKIKLSKVMFIVWLIAVAFYTTLLALEVFEVGLIGISLLEASAWVVIAVCAVLYFVFSHEKR